MTSDLPEVMTVGPNGTQHNTYFFDPTSVAGGTEMVQQFSAMDTRPAGLILLAYFHFYAFEFDWRRQVVSIIKDSPVLKEEKARKQGWRRHARLSIEDPFETGYDVGHVLREETAHRLREEFGRAYYILVGGTGKSGRKAIEQLLEKYEPPEAKEDFEREDKAGSSDKVKDSRRPTSSKTSVQAKKSGDKKRSTTKARADKSGSHDSSNSSRRKKQGNHKSRTSQRKQNA